MFGDATAVSCGQVSGGLLSAREAGWLLVVMSEVRLATGLRCPGKQPMGTGNLLVTRIWMFA